MKNVLRTEFKIPLIYLLLSIIWILFSDSILFNNEPEQDLAKMISIIKGLIFISLSTFSIYLLVKNDLLKLRKVNHSLKLSNEFYYSLFKNNHMASLLIEPNNLIIEDANQSAVNLYGYRLENLIGKSLTELSITPFINDFIISNNEVLPKPKQIYRKSFHKTAYNKNIEVEIYMGPVQLNEKLTILAVINDITEKSFTETALKDSEQKYKKLVENIPDVFYVFSLKNGLLYISPQIKPLIGYFPTKAESLKDIIYNHVHPEDKSKFLSCRKTIFDSFEPMENSYRIIDSDKKVKWVLDRVFLITPVENDVIIEGVISDISEKHKLIEELTVANETMNDSLRLKNVMMSNLNHELRTPLNGIIGFSNLISQMEISEEIHEYINLVLDSAYRLNSTLNSILTLNEIEAGHREIYLEDISIKEYLNNLYDSYIKNVKKKGLNFEIDYHDDMKFYTDINILNQIFFNLLDNAIKFTEKGSITLKGDFVLNDGMWIRISVIDTGYGISKEYLDKIYEPFRQESEGVSRNFEGMGIGLTICYKLIILLEGKIEVKSEVSRGSTFMIYLPFKIPKTLDEH